MSICCILITMMSQQVAGSTSPPPPHEGLSRRRRIAVLLICSMSLLIVGLDVSIVNVALPSIGRQLHTSVSGLQWTVDAYTLVIASLLILSGSTADRVGRRRIFLAGLVIFTTSSLLCSVAPNLGALVSFRMLQGIGASMLSPVALSIVTNTFTEPRERAKAIGVWASVFGLSTALGPVIGGVLVTGLGWRSIFWINLPVGLAAIALTLRFVPESRAETARRLDAIGQLLVIALLASLTFGVIEAPRHGWGSTLIVTAFAVAVAALAGLIAWESHHHEPLIELRVFRSVPFAGATATAVAAFAGLGGFLFLNTLYLQGVRGLSPLKAGLSLLPMAVMVAVLPQISGRIVAARGPRIPLILAGLGLTAGCAMLTQVTATTSYTWLFAAYVVFGAGFGLVNPPITNAAVSGMPRARAGVAGALASTSRQVGATLGIAVTGAIVAASVGGEITTGRATAASLGGIASASHAAWWVLTGCSVAVLALGLVVTTAWARATADRTAHELNPEFLTGATR
jgi:EmrB/QacA subfamily drug resistance transporter